MRASLTAAVLALAAVATSLPAQAETPGCPKPNALGVGRTVEIDTKGGPGFGFEHYKAIDFLQPKEVVLTFDDGPQKFSTESVLAALAEQCTKATFFTIGKMALGYPEIIREVAKAGHTIGTHTWSHQAIAKLKTPEEGKDEIERGFSAVRRAVGGPIAPFFRFPTLVDTPAAVTYLGTRNIAMFSTDIDSFDFKLQPPEQLVKGVMAKLDKTGKGIVLMHDIHKNTAKALPLLLAELKAKGYKIVHLTAKEPVTTVAEFDQAIEKDAKGLPQIGAEKPVSSVVRTIEGTAPPEESQPPAADAQKQGSAATAAETAAPQAALTPVPSPATLPSTLPAPAAPVSADMADVPSPVTTVPSPGTTASIANPEKTDGATETGAAVPSKSLSQKAQEVWELWFGK